MHKTDREKNDHGETIGLLTPLIADPKHTALFFDIDGTLAAIAPTPESAVVEPDISNRLRRLSTVFALVACVSGRTALDARRLVGISELTYIGNHGIERLEPGAETVQVTTDLGQWQDRIESFIDGYRDRLASSGIRLESKSPATALHWRGVDDEPGCIEFMREIAHEATDSGYRAAWGRKVLEIRPPTEIDKGKAIASLIEDGQITAALYVGDDRTDLDAFASLRTLRRNDSLDHVVCVGVNSDEGPQQILDQADLVVEGVPGVKKLIEQVLGLCS